MTDWIVCGILIFIFYLMFAYAEPNPNLVDVWNQFHQPGSGMVK